MSVYVDKAKGRWRFTFNRVIAGQRTRATKLLPAGWSRSRAEAYDRAETSRLYAFAAGLERPEPSIGEAVALYLDHRIPKLRSGKKIAKELAHLVPFLEGRPISQLAAVVREYAQANPELSDGTLHNRFAYLKAAGRYAWKRHKLTDHDPTGQMEIPRPKNARDVQLPVARIQHLLRAIEDVETRALFTLAFRVGSRWVKGVYPRKPEDVVRVGRDVWLNVGITKNGSPRMKWVHPDARWALAYLPFKLAHETYYRRFVEARERVGLPDFWPHDIRHVIATDIRKRGGPLDDVGAALDHDSYASSERYAHIVPAHIKRVLQGVGGTKKMHTAGAARRRKRAA